MSLNNLQVNQALKQFRNFDKSTSFAKQCFEIYIIPENEEEPASKHAKLIIF
ncbi:6595_t:CDS:1, partial [Funneliformis mosseae]